MSDDPKSASAETWISASDSKATLQTVQDAVSELWRVVDSLSRVRSERQEYYRVTIFGSARLTSDGGVYQDVKRLAAELASLGCDIVTGGGPGLMQAANEGEAIGDASGRTRSYGLRIELPFEQGANPFVERLFHHGTFFSRLHHFVTLSSAYVVVAGGIGTMLELAMVWQLMQVRQLHNTPLILIGPMWKELVAWAERSMAQTTPPMAGVDDVRIPTCVNSVDEAIAILRDHHAQWLATGAPAPS